MAFSPITDSNMLVIKKANTILNESGTTDLILEMITESSTPMAMNINSINKAVSETIRNTLISDDFTYTTVAMMLAAII
jgi:hypothetical protein